MSLLWACAPVSASKQTAEIEAKIASLRSELNRLETQLATLKAGTSTSVTTTALSVPAAVPSQGSALAPPPTGDVREASNSFLDKLIVVAFLAVAISFVAGRYRDSKSSALVASASGKPNETPIPTTSGSVVFYSREEQSHPSVASDPEPEESAEASSGEDEVGETDSQATAAPAPSDLRVEPKRKGRKGSDKS